MDTSNEVSFGEWLKRRRNAIGLTQQQLAAQIHCSTSTLKKIEAEARRPSAQLVKQLTTIFEIPPKEHNSFLRFARGDAGFAPTADATDTPWRISQPRARSYLPAGLTKLIGRERDVDQVRQYLADPIKRLVTLTGPPGIGKTSLSRTVAEDSMADFLNGVFFVALAPLDDPDLVASTISQTLRFEGRGKRSDLELLKDGIADKQILLVLDNFEHVLEAAAVVPELLIACPRLKILVTSREALRVPGEWIYPVPPLSVPLVSQSRETGLDAAHDFSALLLFAERARAVRAEFKLNPENTNIIAAICARLDGLPLAIELIAARIRLMSPQELLSRMDNQFTLYADGMRAMQPRQKTLYNSIAWSYDLLPEDEKTFFAQLGVFAGSFTLDAAAYITGNTNAIHSITTLLDKSLLQRVVGEQEQTRFAMLFTIREFALNRLDEMNETARSRNRHLEYYIALAKQADSEIHGPTQVEWLDLLEAEHDNYRAVLDWCITSGNSEAALYLIGSFSGLGRFWSIRNYLSEARSWFDKIRVAPDITLYPIAYAMALNSMALISTLYSDYETARAIAEESQSICQRLRTDGELELAGALLSIGLIALWGEADILHAKTSFEQAIAIYQTHDYQWERALALSWLGDANRLNKNYEMSRLFCEDSLRIFRELDDVFGLGQIYGQMGALSIDEGDYDQASRLFEQSLYCSRKLRSQADVSSCLGHLGTICRLQGDYNRAEPLYEEALNICREYNLSPNALPQYLGFVNLHRGDYAIARKFLVEFTRTHYNMGIHYQFGEGLLGLAAVAAGTHQYGRAARLVGAGQAVHGRTAYVMQAHDCIEIDPLLQTAREHLGEERFESLAAEGHAMTMEQAVDYALKDT